MQRRYLETLLAAFDPAYGGSAALNPISPVYGGRMIEVSAIHLWTWDARPYPVFPAALDVWSDGANWHCGHWLNGRLGGAPLDALLERLARDSGVTGINAGALRGGCDGYVVDRSMTPRAMIEPLALAYAFNATTADGTLRFVPRGGDVVGEFSEDDLVAPDDDGPLAQVVRAQETELPRQVGIGFSDALADYRRAAVTSRKLVGGAARMLQADLAVITSDAAATQRAEVWLQDLWAGRERAEFSLGKAQLALAPGDTMEWGDLAKQVIALGAPMLGTALGGVAGEILAKAVGSVTPTPTAVQAALPAVDPNKLAEAEAQWAEMIRAEAETQRAPISETRPPSAPN